MLGITALLLATSISAAGDNIFESGLDGASCPDGRIMQSDLQYGDTTLTDVDVTAFENLWGRGAASDPPVSWPGLTGSSPMILDFARTGYLAAKFHTSADPADTLVGMFEYVSYPYGASSPHLDFSITTECGNFSPEQSGCIELDVAAVDVPLGRWRVYAGNAFYCQLQSDTDYFVNVRFSDPAATGPQCTDDACPIPIQSYFGE